MRGCLRVARAIAFYLDDIFPTTFGQPLNRSADGLALGGVAMPLCGAFMASLAWAGHGAANASTAGEIQVVADVVHLVAAGAWIGGLMPFAR